MGPVSHRHDEAGAAAGALALEQGGDDLQGGGQAAGREVGDLDGRYRRGRVRERAGPAHVVEVVSRALLVAVADSEPRDRAEDRGARHC
jgi:hypothetical protein